jgi:chromosome segregation ATPase
MDGVLKDKDAELERLKAKVTQLHQQATDKVNRANDMLAARDAQIHELRSQLAAGSDGIVAELEKEVKKLEQELIRQKQASHLTSPPGSPGEGDSEGSAPVFAAKKQRLQRAGAPPASAPAAASLNKVEAELREALNDQQAEFEQLLAKQAEEMTAQFEEMLMLTRAENTSSHEEVEQMKADRDEKANTCESLKRLITQQDEVVAEQKKVLEAQASSASFAVENLQKMLREAQQKLKDDAERLHSKDAELEALHETLRKKAGIEQNANQMRNDHEQMTNQVAELLRSLEARNVECSAMKKQLQGLAREKEEARQKSVDEIKRLETNLRRQIDDAKAKNLQLIKDADVTMKRSWEAQDEKKHLTRQLEELRHALDTKDKTVSKLSFQLKQEQQNLNDRRTKMDRMENVIMIQESKIQESNELANRLRARITGLEQSIQAGVHETELGAFEELAAVKNKLHIVEGEYEAMKGMVDNRSVNYSVLPPSSSSPRSPRKLEKQSARMQRSAPPPPPSQGIGAESVEGASKSPDTTHDLHEAQLEMELQQQKERADSAEHELTQLKVDIMMYEEKYEDGWKEELDKKKQDLLQEMLDLRSQCHEAGSMVDALRVRVLGIVQLTSTLYAKQPRGSSVLRLR